MRRERLLTVVALVVLGAAVVLASTQVFATVAVPGAKAVAVTGQQVAPAFAPLGIVLLAAAAALPLAGRVARPVLGTAVAVLGAVVVVLAVPSVLDPLAGTRGAVTAVTGVGGSGATSGERGAAGTAWPALAAAAGVLVVLTAAWIVLRGRRWASAGRRFRSAERPASSGDPVDEWDALTRGGDPTAPPEAPAPPGPTP